MRTSPGTLLRPFIPLLLFGLLVAVFLFGIGRDPTIVPSPLVGRQLPAFTATRLDDSGKPAFAPAELDGQVWLLNVWASWCAPCLTEHPQVEWLAGNGLAVIGLNYKDEGGDARRWLDENGDPFAFSLVDAEGAIGLDLGVYGVPESFLVGPAGTVVYKHIGPILAPDAQLILKMAEAATAAQRT